MKDSVGFILVFDVSSKYTFDDIPIWLKLIEENCGEENYCKILVGNKCDITDREVTQEEGKNLADKYNMKYFETSCKSNKNVNEIFYYLGKQILKTVFGLQIKDSDKEEELKNAEIIIEKQNIRIKELEDLLNKAMKQGDNIKEKEDIEKLENQKLKEELNKAKKTIEFLNNRNKELEEQLKNIKNAPINNDINDNNLIKSLKEQIAQKDEELNVLKLKLKNLNLNIEQKSIPLDQLTCVNFLSSDQKIHLPIPCDKNDIFVHIEEKLYQNYPEYKETNNYFISNGKTILRFKTIKENNINNSTPVILFSPNEDN